MTDLVDADDATRAAPTEPAAAWPTPTGPPVGADRAGSPSIVPTASPAVEPKLSVATGPGAIFSDAFAGDTPGHTAPAPAIPAPSIPAAAPAAPSGATPAGRAYAEFLASGVHDVATSRSGSGRSGSGSRGRSGRWFSRLVVLVVLGGLAAAGAVWGPELYERWRAEEAPVAEVEPAAPLTFPTASEVLLPIRTATFVIDGPGAGPSPAAPRADGDGGPAATPDQAVAAEDAATGDETTNVPGAAPHTSYTVTIDFESTASRIVIDRGALPDLEVLTVFDDAVVRRVDSEIWFRMPRGELPVTEPADRLHWVRSLDELFPPEVRQGVSIAEASVSEVAGVPTRRLRVRFDPSLLGGQMLGDPAAVDPTALGPAPLEPAATGIAALDPTTAGQSPAQPTAAQPTSAQPTGAIAETAAGAPATPAGPSSTTPDVTPATTGELEIWVDDAGLVRRATGDLLRGATAVTVLEVSDQSWLPVYPDPSQLRPLTAAALIELGL